MDRETVSHETSVRVRYGEVDRMGVVYHGHYLVYFEQGRTEFMRSLGATYRQVEESGTLLVVVETGLKFLQPARYDDELTIRTRLALRRGVRLRFEYTICRGEKILVTGFTVLASCDLSGRPRRMPEALVDLVPPPAGDSGGRKESPASDVQEAEPCR
jgi:acyl-CoA thioester hydrolase